MKLKGKVAIITGAARGMGAAHALALAREGADIAICDIGHDLPQMVYSLGTEKGAKSIVEQIQALGRQAIFVKCDVSKASEVEAMVNRVVKEFGKIDILVNNAGLVIYGIPVWELTEEQWDVHFNVILKGAFLCCKYVIPHMLKQGTGRIINIGSSGTRRGSAGNAPYAAAKVALHNLTYEIAADISAYGGNHEISVNCVAPGVVDTPIHGAYKTAAEKLGLTEEEIGKRWTSSSLMQKMLPVDDIANAVVFLASDEARSINGIVLPVDGGMMPG